MRLATFTTGLCLFMLTGVSAESENKAASGKEKKAVAKSTEKAEKASAKENTTKEQDVKKTAKAEEPAKKKEEGAKAAGKETATAKQEQKAGAKEGAKKETPAKTTKKAAAKTEARKAPAKQAKKTQPPAPKATKKVAAAPQPAASSGEVTASRVVACQVVDNREPQGAADAFAKDVGKVYCFSHIKGVRDTLVIKHVWYHNDTQLSAVPLDVKSPSWRTYSYRTIDPAQTGTWKVQVVEAESGNALGSVSFTIQ